MTAHESFTPARFSVPCCYFWSAISQGRTFPRQPILISPLLYHTFAQLDQIGKNIFSQNLRPPKRSHLFITILWFNFSQSKNTSPSFQRNSFLRKIYNIIYEHASCRLNAHAQNMFFQNQCRQTAKILINLDLATSQTHNMCQEFQFYPQIQFLYLW